MRVKFKKKNPLIDEELNAKIQLKSNKTFSYLVCLFTYRFIV